MILYFSFFNKNYKEITKTAVCPKCKEKVEIKGKSGQHIRLICPSCKTQGTIKL